MSRKNITNYKPYDDFLITENSKERTVSIYTKDKVFLSTVDHDDLSAEIERIKNSE